MRENGLRAAAYVAVADLHPQLADVMLDALADEGVAAYASPSPAASGRGLTMPTQLPAGPVDRLWVDRDAAATARRVLDVRLPELRAELENATLDSVADRPDRPIDPDTGPGGLLVDDDTWSSIIASYRSESASRPGRPATDDDDTAPPPRDRRTGGRSPEARRRHNDRDADDARLRDQPGTDQPADGHTDGGPVPWPEEAVVAAAAPRARRPDDPDDHYEPPLPPPLPTADTTTRMAWAGVIGGPLLFLLAILLDWNLPAWAKLVGVAALVVGFVTLVARMRDGGEELEDGGAVV